MWNVTKILPCAYPASLPVQARGVFLSRKEQWVVCPSAPHPSPGCVPGGMQGTAGGPARRCPGDQRTRYFFQRRGNPAESGSAAALVLVEPKHVLSGRQRRRAQPGAGRAAHGSHTAAAGPCPRCDPRTVITARSPPAPHGIHWRRIDNAAGLGQPRVKRPSRAGAAMRGAAAGAGRWGCGQRPAGSMLSPKIRQARRGEWPVPPAGGDGHGGAAAVAACSAVPTPPRWPLPRWPEPALGGQRSHCSGRMKPKGRKPVLVFTGVFCNVWAEQQI